MDDRLRLSAGNWLHRWRTAKDLSLRDVSKVLEDLDHSTSPATLHRIESGKQRPGIDRLTVLLELYDLPVHLAGIGAWKEGDFSLSMALFLEAQCLLAREEGEHPLQHSITLNFAIGARNAGKLRLAQHLIEMIPIDSTDLDMQVRCLILLSSLHKNLGHDLIAESLLEKAIGICPEGNVKLQSWVCHQAAVAARDAEQYEQAESLIESALAHYSHLDDPANRLKARIFLAESLCSSGQLARAETIARSCLADTEDDSSNRSRALALRCFSKVSRVIGEIDSSLDHLEQAREICLQHGDVDALFWIYYEHWLALHESNMEGQKKIARLALDVSRQMDDGLRETREALLQMQESVSRT
jgi:transcriptional regulator with XRE-family HTH domain